MPAETHRVQDDVHAGAVLDFLAVIVDVDPIAAVDLTLAVLDLDDDFAVLDLWGAVVEEFGERSLGDLEPLEPRPVTLGQLAEAFQAALSPLNAVQARVVGDSTRDVDEGAA